MQCEICGEELTAGGCHSCGGTPILGRAYPAQGERQVTNYCRDCVAKQNLIDELVEVLEHIVETWVHGVGSVGDMGDAADAAHQLLTKARGEVAGEVTGEVEGPVGTQIDS